MDPALVKYPIVSHPGGDSAGDLVSEPWFVSLLGSVVFVLVLLFAGTVVYRRQWSRRAKSLGHLPVPPVGNRYRHSCSLPHSEVGSFSKDKSRPKIKII